MSMQVLVTNHDFTHGRVNRNLFARTDLEIYNSCAQTINNMVVLPGGSARSRFGTQKAEKIKTELTGLTVFHTFPFSNKYGDFLIILSNDNLTTELDVYRISGATTRSLSLTAMVLVPAEKAAYEGTVSRQMIIDRKTNYAQNQSELITTNGAALPFVFSVTSPSSMNINPISFKHPPSYDFHNYDSPITFSLSSVVVGTAVLTCSSSIFTADNVGGAFIGIGPTTGTDIGRAFVTAYTNPTTVSVDIIAAFDSTYLSPAVSSGDNVILTENAFTATNGFPSTVCFFENRLCFAGTSSLPQAFWASQIGDYFNFDIGVGSASDAINYIISTKSDFTEIKHMVSSKSLQVFTSDGEYASPAWASSGFTPGSSSIRLQTPNGSTDANPVVLDNSTLYVKKGGKAIYSFVAETDAQTYRSTDLTIMTDEIINNIVRMEAYSENHIFDGNILFSLKSSGTAPNQKSSAILYQSLAEQNVVAFTTADPAEGVQWLDVVSIQGTLLLLSRIKAGANYDYWVEQLWWPLPADHMQFYPAGALPATLPDYSNHTVEFVEASEGNINSGSYFGSAAVDASGNYTPPADVTPGSMPTGTYVVKKFTQTLKPMPVHFATGTGDNLYLRKRVSCTWVDYYNSFNFNVNGVPSLNYAFPIKLDSTPSLKSGILKLPILQGWEPRQSITISSDHPLHINILGLAMRVTI